MFAPEEPAAAAPEQPTPEEALGEAVPEEPAAPEPAPRPPALTATTAAALAPEPGEEDPLVAALVARGLSARFARAARYEAAVHLMPFAPDQAPDRVLRDALARRIPIAAPRRSAEGGVVGFVGPGGSGKTRCVARLATAYATRTEMRVACLTLRPKEGAEELSRLLEGTGVPVLAEDDAEAAVQRIAELRGHALVLLDTPSLSPRAEAQRRTLAAELRRLAPDELHVCVPATIGPAPGRELAAAAREVGAYAMALTHLDETDAVGAAVELAIDGHLPISYLARGTAVQSGLRPAQAEDIALALLP
jgi:flagellar biosynthesis GTPase FlhF